MQFLITAHDGRDMLGKRMAVRPVGSVLVMDFPGRGELDAYLRSEPYLQEKVWEAVSVEPMNVVILNGEQVGT